MSRAAGNRPTHIALPNSPFGGRSPNGSPLPTPSGQGAVSPTSPRSSFIPSFIRTRSRAATLTGARGRSSPSAEVANPLAATTSTSTSTSSPQRPGPSNQPNVGVTRSVSTPQSGGLADSSLPSSGANFNSDSNAAAIMALQPPRDPSSPPKTFRIRLVPHLETSRSLAFDPVVREVMPMVVPSGTSPSVVAGSLKNVGVTLNGRPPALMMKIGRFTEKTPAGPASGAGTGAGAGGGSMNNGIGSGPMSGTMTIAGGGGDICASRVAFKSKVVSRSHAEIWCEPGGKFYIRDTSSSSGTFLNHIRLSSPNTDSRPTQINDGDILQLGVDYQGGHEDMFRCVKMRVEMGREWQRGANEFNTNALRQLKALGGAPATPEGKGKQADQLAGVLSSGKKKASVTDCCICLFSVTVCQSLFIAPCSHVFHYKCIRPLLQQHHPGFSCPLCRTFANLDEDVETEDAWELASRRASVLSRKASNHSLRIPSSDALAEIEAADAHAAAVAAASSIEPMDDLSLHDRQATAVHPETSVTTDDSVTRHAEDEQGHPRMMISEETAAIPISSTNGFATSFSQAALSQAATPMNDTFLSTLAPMPIHQRLDLADQLENSSSQGHGSGVPETLEEESDSLMESEREAVDGDGDQDRRRGSGTDEGVFELRP